MSDSSEDWLQSTGAECLTTRLRRASDRWAAVVRSALADAGISGFEPGWWALFRLVAERPGLSSGAAAALLGLSAAAVSQTASALGRAGLLLEGSDAADARIHRLHLSAAGFALAPRLAAVARALDARLARLPQRLLPDVEGDALREGQ